MASLNKDGRDTCGKQSSNLMTTIFMVQWTSYIGRVLGLEPSLPACQRVRTIAMGALESLTELPGTVA